MTLPRPVLAIEGLDVVYGRGENRVHAVRGAGLTIAPGEFVAVVGQSGSGKSSLAHAIIDLLPFGATRRARSIRFDGIEIGERGGAALHRLRGREIGFVPQDPTVSLDPVKTIGNQIGETLREHGIARGADAVAMTLDLLDQVGIDRPSLRIEQYPHEISGGMRQRVLIAIALCCDPRLVIADEPTSGLDVTVQQRVLDRLAALVARRGTAVLFITHDLGVAVDRADRIVVMNQGEMVEQGTIAEVISRPREAYTRELLAAVPRRPTVAASPSVQAAAPAADREVILCAENLTKDFASGWLAKREPILAVNGVTLQLARGRTLAVVGESGSGKTTLARMIAGLAAPTAGRILHRGEPIGTGRGGLRADYRRAVQFVYQNPFSSLNPKWRIEAIIADPLRVNGIGDEAQRKTRAAELADAVALPRSLLTRRAAELSGGQLQRVAIARALSLTPEILILDEPVSALDVKIQATILDLLRRLQRELGLSYLFISHDLGVVNLIAHDIAIMQAGRLVENGPATSVFGAPQDAYTRSLIDAIPGRRLAELAG